MRVATAHSALAAAYRAKGFELRWRLAAVQPPRDLAAAHREKAPERGCRLAAMQVVPRHQPAEVLW